MSASTGPVPLAHLDMMVADGVFEAQARAIWHVVAETRADRVDALAAHAEIAETHKPLVVPLVEVLLRRR